MVDRNDDPDNPYGGYDAAGLYIFGPRGPICVLALLVYYTFCVTSSATPDGQRRERVAGKAQDALRAARRWRDDPKGINWRDVHADHHAAVLRCAGEPVEDRRFAYVGRFTGPRKPANSGRRKKAA